MSESRITWDGASPANRPDRSCPTTERSDGRRLRANLLPFLALSLLLATALIRPYILEPFYIPSNSMSPLLRKGDRILVDKLPRHRDRLDRGSVIVFQDPSEPGPTGAIYVKRIIGLPGEHLSIYRGSTLVEGHPLRERFLGSVNGSDFGTVIVPEGSYFVMGDNRLDSRDSRSWGAIPRHCIIGRAVAIFWPANRIRRIPPYAVDGDLNGGNRHF